MVSPLTAIIYLFVWLASLFLVLLGLVMIHDSLDNWRRTGRFDFMPRVMIGIGVLMITFGVVMFCSVIGRAAMERA